MTNFSYNKFDLKKCRSLFNYWDLPKNKSLAPIAKKLRKSGNLSEVILWQSFKSNDISKYDIDRQIIIGNFIVDFFIDELGLVIEIDCNSHNYKFDYDSSRDKYLENLGLDIIHITDIDVKNNLENVLKYIKSRIDDRILKLLC